MKKSIAILLIVSTFCLTACNNQTVETSMSTSEFEYMESTNVTSHPTHANQTTKITSTNETTNQTEKPNKNQGYQIPEEAKNQILGLKNRAKYIELPSRIIFSQNQKGFWRGDVYYSSGEQTCYFNKADGEVYLYCFDPLCSHTSCDGTKMDVSSNSVVFTNNRFYEITYKGELYSFAFDGTDKKCEYTSNTFETPDGYVIFKSISAFDRYVYIDYLYEDGNYHCLRFDTERKNIEDLTEKTGNYIVPQFFYNGEIWGYDREGVYWKCDLSLEHFEEVDRSFFNSSFHNYYALGSLLIGTGREKDGIHIYDMQTGILNLLSNEMIGQKVAHVFYADENYIYFFADAPIELITGNIKKNNYGGKIYRVNYDGTNCICIYENTEMNFSINSFAMVYKDTIILFASKIGIVNNNVLTWENGKYIGTINADGTIDSLEWVEVIA